MSYLDEIARDLREAIDPGLLPEGEKELLFLLYALLVQAKGTAVSSRDVHDAWVVWMLARGEAHESMRPFEDLPPSVRAEDEPFVRALRAVAGARESDQGRS